MKTLTMHDLSRKTAAVLDALERGETFELHRNGKAVGYLTHTAPPPERKPDWKAHFDCGSVKRILETEHMRFCVDSSFLVRLYDPLR